MCALKLTKGMVLIAVMLFLQACGTTVHQGERGVRGNLITGGVTPEILKSGFHWRAPWSQIYVYNIKWRRYAETIDAVSSDGLPITIKTVILLRPTPDEVPILAQDIGSDFYPRAVRPALLTAVRSAVSSYPIVTVVEYSSDIAGKVEAAVVEKLKGRHLQVANIAMMPDLELGKLVPDAVEQKQAAEREKASKEVELIIAEQASENTRHRGIGEGDAHPIWPGGVNRGTDHSLVR